MIPTIDKNNIEEKVISILLVEDNDDDAFLILQALNEGFNCHRIVDGLEALEFIKQGKEKHDIVLLDKKLPSMDGLEILQQVEQPEDRPAFIFLTADSTVEVAVKAMKAGALDFFHKSTDYDELPEVIRKVFRIHHNANEKRKLETALHQSEQRFHMLMDTMNEGCAFVDSSAKILYVNHSLGQMLGYSPAEMLDTSATNYMDAENSDLVKENLLKRKNGKRETYELTYTCKSGQKLETVISPNPVYDLQGHHIGSFAVITDITKRKKHERQLLESKKKAEEASRAKSHFLANISHELRTPLNGILGMSRLLANTELSDLQKEYLVNQQLCAENLFALINNILDYSKIDGGKLHVKAANFDLHQLIHRNIAMLTPHATQKNLTLSHYIDNRIPIELLGDSLKIQQVLINLIDNAIKFTRHGNIALRIELVDRKYEKISIRFAVSDTGIGIQEHKLSGIFNSFQQVDGTYQRQYGGVGLGLTIVKDLVELMNGDITVESQEGEGSHFVFTLPLKTPHTPAKPAPQKEATDTEPFKGLNILVAEDDVINRFYIKAFLSRKGARVEEALNGIEVLEVMEKKDIHLVLMDIGMPHINGIDATREIREKECQSSNHIPIIALTAHSFKEDRERCIAAGVDSIIFKPISEEELVRVISEYTESPKNTPLLE
ncbi:MAG: response regulator [bacterium]|nr:response regulator [bacterium]